MLHRKQAGLSYSGRDGDCFCALERESTSIGRTLDQDLVLQDGFASRHHAVIKAINGSYELLDDKSSHGTYLNGVRIVRI
jgi:pSer/pThr/pTyr-binding forkhead associated (FHA) protein